MQALCRSKTQRDVHLHAALAWGRFELACDEDSLESITITVKIEI